MELHQISVTYEPVADRLMMRVRGRQGEQFAGWFTRRLMGRLWPVMQKMAAEMASAAMAPGATVLPEAKALLCEARRAEALLRADLATPFDAETSQHPVGPEPLLLSAVNVRLLPGAQLAIGLKGADGRSFNLRLGEDLAQAWMHLTEKALLAADWGLLMAEPSPTQLPSDRRPHLLN
jgi:hypothetical protein